MDAGDGRLAYLRRRAGFDEQGLQRYAFAVPLEQLFLGWGRAPAWTKRGPNFRSETGTTTISFAIDPTRIDAGSSLYVSASIGGDPTIKDPSNNPIGYATSSDNVVRPKKSTLLIWYLGAPPAASLFPGSTLYEYSLGKPKLNTWTSYSINVSSAVAALPAADHPIDYDALSDLKIAASANGGTASGYFDKYVSDAPTATSLGASLAADEFVARNTIIDAGGFNTSSFVLFPSVELAVNEHANRFNFDITAANQFVSYSNGIDGISPTQATGYPAQLNHPGVPGGVTDSQATSTNAEGADLMEVRQANMITDWDTILRQVHPLTLIGTWGNDDHIASWSGSSQATYIYAPSLSFDSLMHALYEGRAYMGMSKFSTGQMAFNLDPTSTMPYPARYPVYSSSSVTSQQVHLAIAAGLSSGDTVRWLANGGSSTTTSVIATDPTSGSSYSATKTVSVAGSSAYVRAEVRDSSGNVKAMTEPIVFKQVSGLPAGTSVHVDSVTPTGGCQCSLQQTKGITAASWNSTTKALSLSLTNPANSTVDLVGTSGSQPTAVTIDGSSPAESTSLSAYQATPGDAWYYDTTSGNLYLQDAQSSTNSSIVVSFGGGGSDTSPPSVPTNVVASAVSSTEVDLSWTPSTDNVGVDHYDVYRNNSKLPTPAAGSTSSYKDTTALASTTYTYCVVAYDAAGNASQAPPGTACAPPVTTPTGSGGGNQTLTPVADSYVNSAAPTTNYGTAASIYVDGDGIRQSYLTFDLTGVTGTVTGATLKVWANSSQSTGYDVYGVGDTTWGETAITWNNKPAMAATKSGSSGAVTSGTWTTVTLPAALVQAALGGRLGLGLQTTSSTNLNLASRESVNKPQLTVTTN